MLAPALLALVCACSASEDSDANPDPNPGTTVSFARDVQPIFTRCLYCHYTGSGFDLSHPFDPVEGLIGKTNGWHDGHDSPLELLVEPGHPELSFLVYKVSADPDPVAFDTTNNGNPMPFQIPRLTAEELMRVRQWITDGAKNDDFFTKQVASIFGTELSLGRKGGRCTLCHYPGSPTGMSVLDVFDPTTGLVGVNAVLSSKPRVDPGNPDNSFLVEKLEQANPSAGAQMPLHPPRLNDTEVAKLRTWIANGAHDD